MSKDIRSKAVKESLMDYETLANSLKENTESAVKSILNEAVRDTYAKLLSEDGGKDYDEEEVEDTASDAVADDAEESQAEVVDDAADAGDEGMEAETDAVADAVEDVDGNEAELADDSADEDEWAEFDKYKVSDDEYDFSNAEDEEIVKVYKLMKNDDQILVHKDDDKVKIQDNETGTEYLIDLGGDDSETGVITDDADDFGSEDEGENNEFEDMNESTERMYELVLEYDSNVGYTDNYQKKDVMTNPGMSEPGKNVNDWDAGVPKGDAKPWSGYPGKKNKADKPFNAGKGKQIEEEADEAVDTNVEECGDMDMTESIHTQTQNGPQRRSTTISQVPDTSRSAKVGRNRRLAKIAGQDSGTGEAAYQGIEEGLRTKINKTLKENRELKATLSDIMESLKGAAVTNHNLAQIIKLISENTTTRDEKMEIITRFAKEGKTLEASKNLYESISNDLKKSNRMNITEEKSLTVESSRKINETPIYQSQDLLESLDLMHRMGNV